MAIDKWGYIGGDPRRAGWYLLTTEWDSMASSMGDRYEGWRLLDATNEEAARVEAEQIFPQLERYPLHEYGGGFPYNPRLVYYAGKVRTP